MLVRMSGVQPNFIAVLLVVVASIAAAILLRWARCPSWPMIGGVLAGIVLGPSILGRIAPDRFEQVFLGGIEQRQHVHELERDLDVARSVQAGMSHAEIQSMTEDYRPRIEQAKAELAAARHAHGLPLRIVACIATGLVLLAGASPTRAASCRSLNGRARRPAGLRHEAGHGGAALINAMSIGAWQAALPGAIAFFLCRWWEFGITESLAAAAAVAIGPWALANHDVEAAEQAEIGGARTIWNAGRLASIIAIGLVVAAIVLENSFERCWPMAVLLALPIGWWFVLGLAMLNRTKPDDATDRDAVTRAAPRSNWLRLLVDHAALPVAAASAMVGIELFHDLDVWMLAAVLILSGDGRWLGALIGRGVMLMPLSSKAGTEARGLPGRRRLLRSMRLVLGSIAAGPTQLAVALLALQSGLIGGKVALALVAGAVVIELAAPLRRSMARRLIEMENDVLPER